MALSVQSRADNLAGSFVESGEANKQRVEVIVPKRRHSQLYEDKITRVDNMTHIPFTVCHTNCRLGCGSHFRIDQIKQNVHRLHYNKTEYEKKHTLLKQRKTPIGDVGNTFMGRKVCTKFYCFANQCSNDYVQGLIKHTSEVPPAKKRHIRKSDTKEDSCFAWWDDYEKFLEIMPDEEGVVYVQFTYRTMGYRLYCIDVDRYPDLYAACSLRTFLAVWKKYKGHIKCRKHSRFTKCDTCEDFKKALNKALSREDRRRIKLLYFAHLDMVKSMRRAYYIRRALSILAPDEWVSIIVDGSDQTAYGLPYFPVKTKRVSAASVNN